MPASFSAGLRAQTEPLWRAVHAHPFVRGIGDGTLPGDRFRFYLAQDYAYLLDFSRVIALATARAESLDDMRRLATLLEVTLRQEIELHRRTCAGLGVAPGALERTEPGLVTAAYGNFLLRTCHEGRFGDVVAALLPCEAGYVEIAARLRDEGPPPPGPYRDWVESYGSPEMRELAGWIAARLDALAEEAAPGERDRWRALYRTSARLELLFFDMAWQGSPWPACVPI